MVSVDSSWRYDGDGGTQGSAQSDFSGWWVGVGFVVMSVDSSWRYDGDGGTQGSAQIDLSSGWWVGVGVIGVVGIALASASSFTAVTIPSQSILNGISAVGSPVRRHSSSLAHSSG